MPVTLDPAFLKPSQSPLSIYIQALQRLLSRQIQAPDERQALLSAYISRVLLSPHVDPDLLQGEL